MQSFTLCRHTHVNIFFWNKGCWYSSVSWSCYTVGLPELTFPTEWVSKWVSEWVNVYAHPGAYSMFTCVEQDGKTMRRAKRWAHVCVRYDKTLNVKCKYSTWVNVWQGMCASVDEMFVCVYGKTLQSCNIRIYVWNEMNIVEWWRLVRIKYVEFENIRRMYWIKI